MKFIANLNGTILCPYQTLLDIAEQIPNSPARLKQLAFMPICDLNSTNDWINLESLGKPVALRSKAICDVICMLLKQRDQQSLTLDVHIEQGQLSSDNLFCLLFLAHNLQSLELTFYCADIESQALLRAKIEPLVAQKHCAIHFKTGSNWPELTANQNALNQLRNVRDQLILGLGFRFEDGFLQQDIISESTINQLIGFSWMCLKSGGYEIPCRLLEQAKDNSFMSQALQEQLFMHLLMIRFFSHQYALIAESEFPDHFETLAASDVRTLHFLTAYSATLSRNLNVAQKFFKKCNITESMPLTDETSLYQLNLFALSKVLQGETNTAFDLEFRIKAHIEAHQIETVGLKYVNFINIARLYKKTKDFDLSLDYYNRAYNEISGGGYATSDHIYYNMNLGSLYEAAGDYELALSYWIKAALHWLACKNQYELSWRPRLILCQETLADIANPLPIPKANLFLTQKINELIARTDIALTSFNGNRFMFVDDSSPIKKEFCLISHNIPLFTAHTAPVNTRISSEEEQLAGLVTQYLNTVMAIDAQQNVFIVDTQLDAIKIEHAEQAMAFARLAHFERCYFNGQWLVLEDFKSLKPVTASLSKVIQSITPTDKGLSVQYKRSFLNKILLDEHEINWVNQLQQAPALSDQITVEDWNIVQQLAKKKIVNFSYPV